MTQEEAFQRLAQRLGEARAKHPTWQGSGPQYACHVILGEADEFWKAVYSESEERQIDEALDVAATCMRFVMGEHQ